MDSLAQPNIIQGSHVSAGVCGCMHVPLCLFPCALFCSFFRAFTVVGNYAHWFQPLLWKKSFELLCHVKCIMMYIPGHNVMTRVIRLHFKPIYTPFLPHVLQLQCNNLPHENCNNLPQGGIFNRSTCQSNTHAHKAVIIPSIYTTGIYTSFFYFVNFQM